MRTQKGNRLIFTLVTVAIIISVGAISWLLIRQHELLISEKSQTKSQTISLQPSTMEETAKQTDATQAPRSAISLPEPKILSSFNELSSSHVQTGVEVVTGYIWNSDKGSPNISSVALPVWGILTDKDFMNKEYAIDIWDGKNFVFYAKSTPLKEVIFPQGGVYKFRVTGIDSEYAICPGDHSMYTWQLKFASNGKFKGERTPMVVDVSSQGKSCYIAH